MRVLFVGAPVDPVQPGNYIARFEATGQNTGNLLIGHGLRRQIAYSSYSYGVERDPASVDHEFDLVAVAAANFIYKGFDLGGLADFLEANTRPMVVVGLGAQMPSNANAEIEIPEGSKRFLKVISERCVDIGVRGEFTADVLSRLGVNNTTITGCPSYYWNLDGHAEIQKKEWHPYFKVSVNGSRNVYDHSYDPEAAKSAESELIRFAQRYRHDYVLQNEFPEFDVLFGNASEQSYQDLSTLSRRHDLRISPEHYAAYVRAHCKAFFDVDEWASFIKTKDLSIGSRFHGNLIALLNGVPAILIAHDSRTTEMAEFMKIPYHRVENCDLHDIRKLYEDADFNQFTDKYGTARNRYSEFMDRNSVPHLLSLGQRQDAPH